MECADDKTYLPDLSEYIKLKSDSETRVVDLEELEKLIEGIGAKVEVYYNPYKLDVETTLERFDIFTQEKI